MDIHVSGATTNDCEIFYVPYPYMIGAILCVLAIGFVSFVTT